MSKPAVKTSIPFRADRSQHGRPSAIGSSPRGAASSNGTKCENRLDCCFSIDICQNGKCCTKTDGECVNNTDCCTGKCGIDGFCL